MFGTIKTIQHVKGFGFIQLEGDPAREFFFHKTDCASGVNFAHLEEGDRVRFDEITPAPPKGRRALKGSVQLR